ncbi:methyl-accepting chemotaxis protein [Anaerosinus massiliensis]|uniref:methyl-accepting chemotaxis protein n=1 Tax=Massilibacillus massiliensis TaxID=1806837 RepID=UPI000B1B733F|nr:methyl-accepting chemotaxis protein [Massilibacillus massiliensis]
MRANLNFKNFRIKFLAILLPVFILSFSILSTASYYLANQALNKSANETAAALGREFSLQVKSTMQERMLRLDELGTDAVLQGADDKAKMSFLADAKKRLGFSTLFYSNLKGEAISSEGTYFNRADREYVKKVLQTKKPYVPEPIVSAVNGKLVLVLTTPVLQNGQMVGMMMGTVTLDNVSKILQEVKFKDSGYGFIADRTGTVIAHHKYPEFVVKLNLNEKKINPELKTAVPELDDALMQSFKSVVETGKATTCYYKSTDDVASVAVLTPIELDDQRWVMVITAPEAEMAGDAAALGKMTLFVSIFFLIVAVLFIFLFAKRLAKPIELIRDECGALNDGDFREKSLSIQTEDEIGQLAKGFQSMRHSLRTLIMNVQNQAEKVAASSEELTANASQSADSSNRVASSIGEIASGIDTQSTAAEDANIIADQLTKTAVEISEKTKTIAGTANQASNEVEVGRSAIAKAVDQMQQIGEGSADIQRAVTELAKGSQEISDIVQLISNIAGQTNLLALNAAIEAARAGEQGRGFAVVADEVRKLAEESNQSSQQIAELVKRNQIDMEKAVAASKAGTEGIYVGIEAVHSADETFKNIVQVIGDLSQEISAISESIEMMAFGSGAMLDSIGQIEKATKTNAAEAQTVSATTQEQSAAMQEIASASQALAVLAGELQTAIAKFKV